MRRQVKCVPLGIGKGRRRVNTAIGLWRQCVEMYLRMGRHTERSSHIARLEDQAEKVRHALAPPPTNSGCALHLESAQSRLWYLFTVERKRKIPLHRATISQVHSHDSVLCIVLMVRGGVLRYAKNSPLKMPSNAWSTIRRLGGLDGVPTRRHPNISQLLYQTFDSHSIA